MGYMKKTTSNHVVDTIIKYYNETPNDPGKVLQNLFDERANISDDNMSAMIILFRDGTAYNSKVEFIECEISDGDDKLFRKACKDFAKSHGRHITKRKKKSQEESKRNKRKKKHEDIEENKPTAKDDASQGVAQCCDETVNNSQTN